MKNTELEQQQAKNAIRWFRSLQKTDVKKGTGKLGNRKDGFCCLGFGCMIFTIPYVQNDSHNVSFSDRVGLNDDKGGFYENNNPVPWNYIDYNKNDFLSLVNLNDNSDATLSEVGTFIEKHYENIFKKEVSKEITKLIKAGHKPLI